jgi:uncharacterized protein (TIGR02147 family)
VYHWAAMTPLNASQQSAKQVLKNAIDEIRVRNPRLSLRAVAKKISVAPSYLSEVLNGKKALSAATASRIAANLKFPRELSELFLALVELELSKEPTLRTKLAAKVTALKKRVAVKPLSEDQFSEMSDWYHFAILEMSQLPDMDLKPSVVASALDIPEEKAKAALKSLVKNQHLVAGPDKRLKKSAPRLNVSSEVRNESIRTFHKQMLSKAIFAVDKQSNKEKFIGSETFPFDSTQLEAAKEIIEDCFSRLVLLAGESEKKDSVYHLGIQMFRLTKEIK